jgi:hypothetical protein
MKQRTKSERGQALILIVLGVIGLLGMAGLAVDGTLAYSDRREAQSAADSAALSAALAYIHGQNLESAALAASAQNGCPNDDDHSVDVHHPPISGPYAGNSEYIQVKIRSRVPTQFGSVVGVDEVTNNVEAVSRARPMTNDNMVFGNAVVALKPNDRGAMRSHGNNDLRVFGGGLFVNSDDGCAFDQMGNSTIYAPDGGVNAVGGVCLRGSIDPASEINTGANAVPYPPIELPPTPVCTEDAVWDKDAKTLMPGNVNGDFPPRQGNDSVEFLYPGVYCVDGGAFMMNAHDTLVGHDVVIYMMDGNIHWNGGANIELSAPTSGPFKGLLIYLPMTNSDGIILNGNMTSSLVGTILAPASDVQLNGTMNSSMYHTQVIGYTVDLIGDADIVVTYNDEEQYEAPIPPAVELVQ